LLYIDCTPFLYIDCTPRFKSVRCWLRLPHDPPIGYFHGKAMDGGLEYPRLRYVIPVMRITRLTNCSQVLIRSCEPSSNSRSSPASYENVKMSNAYGNPLRRKKAINQAHSDRLHESVDGRGLKWSDQTPSVNRWVTDGIVLHYKLVPTIFKR